jgi:uncharacterized membrane protein YvbJ
MVYCTKCGTKNEEDAAVCAKCGASLTGPTWRRERRRREKEEQECFGLPHGGAIVGLIIGIVIILAGLSSLAGIDFGRYVWPLVIVVFGILIVVGALYSYSRRS